MENKRLCDRCRHEEVSHSSKVDYGSCLARQCRCNEFVFAIRNKIRPEFWETDFDKIFFHETGYQSFDKQTENIKSFIKQLLEREEKSHEMDEWIRNSKIQ